MTDANAKHSSVKGGELVVECVDRALDVLGASGKPAALYLLEVEHGIAMRRIASEPQTLITGLRRMFGVGSSVLLKSIIQELGAVEPNEPESKAVVNRVTKEFEEALRSVETGII